jgi:hypothetical protein
VFKFIHGIGGEGLAVGIASEVAGSCSARPHDKHKINAAMIIRIASFIRNKTVGAMAQYALRAARACSCPDRAKLDDELRHKRSHLIRNTCHCLRQSGQGQALPLQINPKRALPIYARGISAAP